MIVNIRGMDRGTEHTLPFARGVLMRCAVGQLRSMVVDGVTVRVQRLARDRGWVRLEGGGGWYALNLRKNDGPTTYWGAFFDAAYPPTHEFQIPSGGINDRQLVLASGLGYRLLSGVPKVFRSDGDLVALSGGAGTLGTATSFYGASPPMPWMAGFQLAAARRNSATLAAWHTTTNAAMSDGGVGARHFLISATGVDADGAEPFDATSTSEDEWGRSIVEGILTATYGVELGTFTLITAARHGGGTFTCAVNMVSPPTGLPTLAGEGLLRVTTHPDVPNKVYARWAVSLRSGDTVANTYAGLDSLTYRQVDATAYQLVVELERDLPSGSWTATREEHYNVHDIQYIAASSGAITGTYLPRHLASSESIALACSDGTVHWMSFWRSWSTSTSQMVLSLDPSGSVNIDYQTTSENPAATPYDVPVYIDEVDTGRTVSARRLDTGDRMYIEMRNAAMGPTTATWSLLMRRLSSSPHHVHVLHVHAGSTVRDELVSGSDLVAEYSRSMDTVVYYPGGGIEVWRDGVEYPVASPSSGSVIQTADCSGTVKALVYTTSPTEEIHMCPITVDAEAGTVTIGASERSFELTAFAPNLNEIEPGNILPAEVLKP